MTDFPLDEIPEYVRPESEYGSEEAVVSAPALTGLHAEPLKRPRWLPFAFVMPVVFCGISWACGGVPVMTDTGMLWLLVACITGVIIELKSFSQRFGIGGMVLFGGVMVWYLHDYFTNWFGLNFTAVVAPYSREVIAKAAFFTCMFVASATVGLLMNPPKSVVRLIYRIPEPPTPTTYFLAILFMFGVGIIPYVFFTQGSYAENFYNAIVSMRSSSGWNFTVGRSGNLNYNWGGYLAQLIQVGQVGGILGMFYVFMIPGSRVSKVICVFIWIFVVLMDFGTGSRGAFLYDMLPVAGMIFIRYTTQAAAYFRRFSKRAYLYVAILMFFSLFVVQIQGMFRSTGLMSANVSQVQVFANQGNAMFSEGLLGYENIPTSFDFTGNIFPGATYIMAVPDVAIRWGISWIPRALWHGKPSATAVGMWYNQQMSGGTATNTENGGVQTGGTVAPSISALAYMGYGWPGVVQIGILYGLLCKLAERGLYYNLHKPFAMMFSVGLAVYLFRAYRDLTPHDCYPLLIGTICGSMGIFILRKIYGAEGTAPAEYSAGAA
jgi:hypothetical protein